MAVRVSPKASNFLLQFSRCACGFAVAFGVMVLTGWALHAQRLKGIIPGQVTAKANTAVCFILLGLALWLAVDAPQKPFAKALSRSLAIVASIVGLLSFLEFWYGWDLGIDQLLFRAGPDDIPGSVRPGLMSPITAADFLLLGITITLLDIRERWSHSIQGVFAATAAVASTFGILDFVLDPKGSHTHIAPLTALILFLLSFAVLCARTDWGLGSLLVSLTPGGELSRRLLPAAILLPLVIGWLRWKLQESALFADWTGVGIMIVSAGILLCALTLWTASVLDRIELARAQAEESAGRLAAIVTSSNDGVIGKTPDGIVTIWNPGAEAIYGYSAAEIVGQSAAILVPPERMEEFAATLECVRGGKDVRQLETERHHKNGKRIFVGLSISPIKNECGEVVGISTITRDITERWQAEEMLKRVNQTLQGLSACTDRMMRATDEAAMVRQVCDALLGLGGYRMAWVGYAEHDENKTVRPVAHSGIEDGYLLTANITWADVERGRGPTGTAIRTGQAVLSHDFANDPKMEPWRKEAERRGYRCSIVLPLRNEDKILGAINIYSEQVNAFDSREQQLLEQLATSLSYAIRALRARAQRDCTEQKLRESALYVRNLIEASLDPLVTISKEGKITDVNEATEKVTGRSRQQLIGSDFSDYFTAPQKAREGYQLVFEKGFVRDYPLAIRNASGKATDVLYNATVFRGAGGEVEGVFAAARDITERKRAEATVLAERQKFNMILDVVSPYVVLLTADYHVAFANREFRKRFGESGGRRCYEFLFGRTEPCEICETYKVLKTGRALDWEWTGPDGCNYEIHDFPFTDTDGSKLILEMGIDVTARKQAEEKLRKLNEELESRVQQRTAELRESEQSVRRKLDSILSPEGDLGKLELADILDIPAIQSLLDNFHSVVRVTTALIDLDGKILAVSGWQDICKQFHRANPEACRNCVESDKQLSTDIAEGEFKIYKCENHMWDAATPIVVGGQHLGNLFCGQFFFADERIDDELFRSQAKQYGFNEESYIAALLAVPHLSRQEVNSSMAFLARLAKVVSQLSYSGIKLARSMTETSRANQDLAASVKELEAFTYSVSHDLRAPLRHIGGFSKILTEEYGPTLAPDAQHHLQRIEEGTRRMGLLVDDLLNLARVGRRDLTLQVTGLASVVEEVIGGLKPDLSNRQVEWKIGKLPYVECDPGLMKQVFQNLLSNAVKFTRPRSPAVIEVEQEQQNGVSVIYVRDNGVGFSMKYADKLFGVFQRLHRTEDFEGTGVGLATVQRIIQKHGGRIWAEAELDKGASFYFTLGSSERSNENTKAIVTGETS